MKNNILNRRYDLIVAGGGPAGAAAAVAAAGNSAEVPGMRSIPGAT